MASLSFVTMMIIVLLNHDFSLRVFQLITTSRLDKRVTKYIRFITSIATTEDVPSSASVLMDLLWFRWCIISFVSFLGDENKSTSSNITIFNLSKDTKKCRIFHALSYLTESHIIYLLFNIINPSFHATV